MPEHLTVAERMDVINMSHDFPDMIQSLRDQGQVQSFQKMQVIQENNASSVCVCTHGHLHVRFQHVTGYACMALFQPRGSGFG